MKMRALDFEQLNRNVIGDADLAALDELKRAGATQSDVIRVAVRAALRCAVGNDMVRPNPIAEWPQYVEMGLDDLAVIE